METNEDRSASLTSTFESMRLSGLLLFPFTPLKIIKEKQLWQQKLIVTSGQIYLEEQASPMLMTSHNVTFNRIDRTLIICL
jgi:hypothetical protein